MCKFGISLFISLYNSFYIIYTYQIYFLFVSISTFGWHIVFVLLFVVISVIFFLKLTCDDISVTDVTTSLSYWDIEVPFGPIKGYLLFIATRETTLQ